MFRVFFPSTSVIILSLLLGSDKLFLSNFFVIFQLVISEAKFHRDISFCKCILINFERKKFFDLSIVNKYEIWVVI